MPSSLTPSSEPPPPAARERVIELLTQHFANDELTEAQLEARLKDVYAARTAADLDAVVAALPASGLVPAQRTDTRISAMFSGQERKLAGIVPRQLTLNARMGYVELDLRDATFAPGVTTIDVHSFMGYVEIRLPEGIRVESHGRALFGYFAVKGLDEESDSVVRITGRAVFGYTEVFLPESEEEEEED
ncbi:MAG TPA: DUF1707 domain-containing protein [Gemmatimonadales bacterium]|nr:DUF1707 domain-containing protein [Gemmatimonadales bacterium]